MSLPGGLVVHARVSVAALAVELGVEVAEVVSATCPTVVVVVGVDNL